MIQNLVCSVCCKQTTQLFGKLKWRHFTEEEPTFLIRRRNTPTFRHDEDVFFKKCVNIATLTLKWWFSE